VKVARRGVGEVSRVEARIAAVRRVRPALKRGRLDRACARRRLGHVDERMLDQLLDRPGDGVAVERIGVLIAGDHEPVAGLEPAVPPPSS
jgi:hypothetical protein